MSERRAATDAHVRRRQSERVIQPLCHDEIAVFANRPERLILSGTNIGECQIELFYEPGCDVYKAMGGGASQQLIIVGPDIYRCEALRRMDFFGRWKITARTGPAECASIFRAPRILGVGRKRADNDRSEIGSGVS
jgi:hypothetical protein